MRIEIWSDIACPWCYVGKRRFERALGSFTHRDDVEVVWRSFELDPAAPRVQDGSQAELLAKKYRVPLDRAEAMNANMTAQAATEGLVFRFDRVRVGNTFDAHRLIHLAGTSGNREAMVERLFRAYLTDGETLGDIQVLVRLAGEAGIDSETARRVLEGNEFTAAVRADEARARTFGISGVPFFAIDERYGVSGAQPPEALLDALREAWKTRAGAAVTLSTDSSSTGACDDGTCAV